MKKCIFVISIMWFISFSAFAQSAPSAGNVLFILDGSGSMWGQVERRHKIVIAKEVMAELVRDLPTNIRAGLQVYGHRSKGDCNDIEMLVPVGSSDRQALIRQIESITPRGKTPITQSFQQAADQLRALEEETTVVLVSDGKETCEGDPCALVRELREQGIRIKVHVVGFDVTHDESEQLVCIADAGGGKYFSADNADQLQEALTQVRQEVVANIDPAPQPPVQVTRIAIAKPGVLEFNWVGRECWGVYRGETRVSTAQCGKGTQGLQAGTYTVKPNNNPAFEPFEITIEDGETKTVTMGGVLVFNWSGSECWGAYRGETRVSTAQCGKGTQGLQAGTYTVRPNNNPAFEPFEITIQDGETTTVTMGGMLVFNWPGRECWGVYREDTRVSSAQCGRGRQGLQAGTYTVRPNNNPAFEPFEITVEDGQTIVVE